MRASIEEYKAVEEAAMKFVKSVAEGNSKYARELFSYAQVFIYLSCQSSGCTPLPRISTLRPSSTEAGSR